MSTNDKIFTHFTNLVISNDPTVLIHQFKITSESRLDGMEIYLYIPLYFNIFSRRSFDNTYTIYSKNIDDAWCLLTYIIASILVRDIWN